MSISIGGKKACLLVIDVQKAFDEIEALGNKRNNPGAVGKIAGLLDAFRSEGGDVIHIRHASLEADSLFRQERPGFAAKPETAEKPGETVIVKHVNSSFIGTDLEKILDERGIEALVITGATTNHCVETTTRMAGNLGYATYLVSDATWTFDRTGVDGKRIAAADIHYMSLSNLQEEFASVKTAEAVLAAMA